MCILKLIDDIKYDIARNCIEAFQYNLYCIDGLYYLYIGLEFHDNQNEKMSNTIESIKNIVSEHVDIQGCNDVFSDEYVFSSNRLAGWIHFTFLL